MSITKQEYEGISLFRIRYGPKIESITAERITDSSYWVNGVRKSFMSSGEEAFISYGEAWDYLENKLQEKERRALFHLTEARERFARFMDTVPQTNPDK